MKIFGSLSGRKYGGRVIYSGEDDESEIEVIEKEGIRSLHFGTKYRQSALNLKNPDLPVLSYSNYMLLGLLLAGKPKNALLLGIGGGNLARMIMNTGFKGRLVAVEKRPLVIRTAYDYFNLPRSERVEVLVAEAGSFMKKTRKADYDLILVDIYDAKEVASPVLDYNFLNNCRDSLSSKGLLLVNIWDNPKLVYDTVTYYLERCFGHQPVCVTVPMRSNRILFCGKTWLNSLNPAQIQQDLEQMPAGSNQQLRKPLEDFLFQLKKIGKHAKFKVGE